jgi:cysteine desulfurase
MIYLDYNATAPIKPAVRVAVLEAMERHGNPSSVHRNGRIARRMIDDARSSVAAMVGAKPGQIVFTGGGTEANTTVLRGVNAPAFVTSVIEHDSVLALTPDAVRLPVTSAGIVDLEIADSMLAAMPKGSLVSIMLVNNETGIIQPLVEIARYAKLHGHMVHCDAVQAAGRLPIDFLELGIDFLTLSAHKIGGPQGVGALVVRDHGLAQPLLVGGGQEMRRRAGTENVAGIVGFGVAALLAADDLREVPRLTLMRDELQTRLLKVAGDDAVVIGDTAQRVANTLNIAMRGVSSETQVMAMDLAGVSVSAGSACSSGKVKASHVVRAMGYGDDIAGSTMRLSLGWNTQIDDITRCADAWSALYMRTCKNNQSKAA